MAGFMFRENRVPHYQRMFQKKDGISERWRTPRSPFMLYPFYTATGFIFISTCYMAGRAVLGYKSLFGSK